MAENNIYSPDDMEKIKKKIAEQKQEKPGANTGSIIIFKQ